jgi:hypothetical protein
VVFVYRSDLEEARLNLSEGLLRLWEQADLIENLLARGKPTEAAKDLLRSIQQTVDQLQRHIAVLIESAESAASEGTNYQ